jgi:ATP synthase protein I
MNDKTNQHDDPEKDEKKQGKSGLKAYARYSGLGIQMVVIILISVWGGIKLDGLFSLKTPVFTIILSLLGVAAAIYSAIRDFIK